MTTPLFRDYAIGKYVCCQCGKAFKSYNPNPQFCSRGCTDTARSADLTGRAFGRLRALSPTRLRGRRAWVCECACGKTRIFVTSHLTGGRVTNCGCSPRHDGALTHGESGITGKRTKEFGTWARILGRCNCATDAAYRYYGGRGVKVAERWLSYENFLSDMGRAPTAKHSIDRIDNNGHYEPGNCRWATPAQQARNTRRTIRVDGRPLIEICEERGLPYKTIVARIQRGQSAEDALNG